jgi:aspartate aminotransferase
MRKFVNQRLSQTKPSATLAVAAKAQALKAAGRSIVNLSAGEPDIDTPEHIKEACTAALRAGYTKYAPVPGIPELREALAHKLITENGINCSREEVLVSNGGKQALYQCFQAVIEEGDEVLLPAPYWVSYPDMIELAGGVAKIVQCAAEDSYCLTLAKLKENISPKTRIVVLNSPSNPTGGMYSEALYKELGNFLRDYPEILIISDEVYEKLVYGSIPFVSFAQACPWLADRTLTVNAFSKTYSMTGWRVGYSTGPLELIKAMSTLQSQSTSGVNTMAQYAALAALNGPQDFLIDLNKVYKRRSEHCVERINQIKGLSVLKVPDGAFYLFVRIDELVKSELVKNSAELAAYLIESVGLAVVPGDSFGDDFAFRISTCYSDENLNNGLDRLAAGIAKLEKP